MGIRSEGIDALIVDQAEFAGGSVAEYLGLPFVTAILTLPLDLHPSFQSGTADDAESARQAPGSFRLGLVQASILALINRHRQEWGLQLKTGLYACDSELAQIAQLPAGFDFPNRKTVSHFHYTGPFVDRAGRRENQVSLVTTGFISAACFCVDGYAPERVRVGLSGGCQSVCRAPGANGSFRSVAAFPARSLEICRETRSL
jgi:hypothetical protein